MSESFTEKALLVMSEANADMTETELIQLVILCGLLEEIDGGFVDSYKVANVIFERRQGVRQVRSDGRWSGLSWDQTKNYVQYLFREAKHVCRHQPEWGVYRVHEAPRCGPECDRKWGQADRRKRCPACPSCGLETTTTGECPGWC